MKTAQTEKFKRPWPVEKSERMQYHMQKAFPEALVCARPDLERILTNHEKDRHVLATAIQGKASVICTFNLKDFPLAFVEPHKVKVKHPADFLIDLYTVEPGVVVDKLQKLAEKRGLTAQQMLIRLGKYVPEFCDHLTEELGWQVD
jgi:hypothetical protein